MIDDFDTEALWHAVLCLLVAVVHHSQSLLYISLTVVYASTVIILFCITHSCQSVLYHSLSIMDLTATILCFCMPIFVHFRVIVIRAQSNHFRIPCSSWYAFRNLWRMLVEGFPGTVQNMVRFGRAQGIQWHLIYIHSIKNTVVINASITANSAGIDYNCLVLMASKEFFIHLSPFFFPRAWCAI